MTKLSEKIIKKISNEKIVPIPKWQFLLKSKFVWTMAIVSVIFGSIAVAISMHLVLSPIDSLPEQSPRLQLWQSLAAVPYFWLLLIAAFIYAAYHNFVHTEDGYRWKTLQILGATIVSSILLGAVLLFSGFAPWLNNYFMQNIPGYTSFGDMRGAVWMNPEEGRLAGQILSINTRENTISLRDLKGKLWTITYDQQTFAEISLENDIYLKIVGKQTGESTFAATEFRPWEGKGMMRRMMQGNSNHLRISK
jgi:hypothetical protein